MFEKKDNIDVKFSGKEYIEYLKYKDNKHALSKNQKDALMIFGLCILGMLFVFLMLDVIFPPEPIEFNYTWEGIFMFMAVCAGLGWLFHGTGFLLVRR